MTRRNMAGSRSNHRYVWADEETSMFLGCSHEKMIKNYHEPKCQLATWYVARVTTCFVSVMVLLVLFHVMVHYLYCHLPTRQLIHSKLMEADVIRISFFPLFFFGDLSKDSLYNMMETWILSWTIYGLGTGDRSPS